MSPKKIACIANMNNNMFCLTRYLRDRGYDAHLFLVDELPHFLPGCDSYDDAYVNYTHQLDWYSTGHWKISPDKIKQDLKGFDFIICCDRIPAYLSKANIKVDMFIPHGGDIFHMTSYTSKHLIPKKWEIGSYYQAYHQKKGIRNASYMMVEMTNDEFEVLIAKLNIKGKRLLSILPIVYDPQYNSEIFRASTPAIREIREKNDLVLLHQSRHVWKTDSTSMHYKGNNVLIEAFADFVKANKHLSCLLILFEYGEDVAASKELIRSLGIEQHVLWLPIMKRKDLMMWIDSCDIGVGGLGRSWMAYGSMEEILSLKKPFVGRRDNELYIDHYPDLYPMVSVKTKEDLYATFKNYCEDKETYRTMGLNSYQWFKKNIVEHTIDQIAEAIESKTAVSKTSRTHASQ